MEIADIDEELEHLKEVLAAKKSYGQNTIRKFDAFVQKKREEYLSTSSAPPYIKNMHSRSMDYVGGIEWEKSVIRKYRERFLPDRLSLGLGTISAHGTDIGSLFGTYSHRYFSIKSRGILFDGFWAGDFGRFESETDGSQDGWWRGFSRLKGQISGQNNTAWILRGDESQKMLIVIPDPRKYLEVLNKVEAAFDSGMRFHYQIADIINLEELDALLQENNGLLVKKR